MRKIDRSKVSAPPSLANYSHTTHSWDDTPNRTKFSGDDKKALRAALECLQDGCCAYCEAATYGGGHIEHFRRKNAEHFPELTFAWENLFLSCGESDRCGHYKDRGGSPYNPTDLIKPDDANPDDFLYFHSDGEVRTRSRVDAHHQRVAEETVRVFNLGCGALRAARRRALEQYIKQSGNIRILDDLMDLFDESERRRYIAMELSAVANLPHSATIRHFFEKVA